MYLALRTWKGFYVRASSSAGREIDARAKELDASAIFAVTQSGDEDRIALMVKDGQYVSAPGKQDLVATGPTPTGACVFKIHFLWPGNIALTSDQGMFVCSEDGGGVNVAANRKIEAASHWETFEVILLDETLDIVWCQEKQVLKPDNKIQPGILRRMLWPTSPEFDELKAEEFARRRRRCS